MTNACIRKLTLRWMCLGTLVSAIAIVTSWYRLGRLPVASTLQVTSPDTTYELGNIIPRFFDPLMVGLIVGALAYLFFHEKWIQKNWGINTFGTITAMVFGVFFGLTGSVIILTCGLAGAVCGAAVVSFVILGANWNEMPDNGVAPYFITHIIASLIMSGVMTLIHGTIAGLVFGGVLLGTSALVHFGFVLLTIAITSMGSTAGSIFRRTMLVCEANEADGKC